nr:MAG TPA: hypothetical protein [Caudoviricetes sp.]
MGPFVAQKWRVAQKIKMCYKNRAKCSTKFLRLQKVPIL